MNNKKKEIFFIIVYFSLLYFSILIGLYFNEDNLGGARTDSLHHFKISEYFREDFFKTLNDYGTTVEMGTRNSPVFWIFLSYLSEFFSYSFIQKLNTLLIFPITYLVYKCLKIKFNDINNKYLIILSSFLFFSPSLRSLIIWPYSLSWGLFFFIISIYFFLKHKKNLNILNSLIIIFFVVIASYIYPSFSVFYLFYLIKIYQINDKKNLFIILFFSFLMAVPCFYFLFTKDFLSAYQSAQGVDDITITKSLNLSNKILIISSMFLYCLLPIINFK